MMERSAFARGGVVYPTRALAISRLVGSPRETCGPHQHLPELIAKLAQRGPRRMSAILSNNKCVSQRRIAPTAYAVHELPYPSFIAFYRLRAQASKLGGLEDDRTKGTQFCGQARMPHCRGER